MEYLLIIAVLCGNNLSNAGISMQTKSACIQRMKTCYEKELRLESGKALLSPLSPEARSMSTCLDKNTLSEI